jgi:hypothetical protein
MTTPRERIAELTRIEEEREERCAWYILRRLSGEIPGQESWARNTIAELIAACEGGIHGRHLERMLAQWDSFSAADYATGDDPEQDSLLLRGALEYAIGWTGWEEPAPFASPHAEAIAECIAYRVANTTYGPGLFEAGFQLSHLSPLFHRVLKEGIDPGIVRVAEDTQPSYTGSRRYPPVVAITPKLRGQIVDALSARGFASELFESGGWHIRSV